MATWLTVVVPVTGLADGDVPVWNSGTSTFDASPGGGGAASVGAVGQVQTSDGAGAFDDPTDVFAGAGYLSVGSSPATTGNIRFGSGATIAYRQGGVDRPFVELTTGAEMIFGGFTAGNSGGILFRVPAGISIYNQIDGSNYWTITSSLITAGAPLAFASSPATEGTIRLSKNQSVYQRNHAGNNNLCVWDHPSGTNELWIGGDAAQTSGKVWQRTNICGVDAVEIFINTGSVVTVTDSAMTIDPPVEFGGGSTSSTGTLRFERDGTLKWRNEGDDDDLLGLSVDSSNRVVLGDFSTGNYLSLRPYGSGDGAFVVGGELVFGIGSGQEYFFKVAGTSRLKVGSAAIKAAAPIIGEGTAWGSVNGDMPDKDLTGLSTYTLDPSEYKYSIWNFSGAPTADICDVVIPLPTTPDEGYARDVYIGFGENFSEITFVSGTNEVVISGLGGTWRRLIVAPSYIDAYGGA